MSKMSLPWQAMLNVMSDLLVHAYNVLVSWMNANDLNNSASPEYWVCELLDRLRWPVEEEFLHRSHARRDYLQTCFSVVAFCYERAGRVFDDEDVCHEIRIRWEEEIEQLFWCYSDDDVEWCDSMPSGWRTRDINIRERYLWNKRDGVLLHHSHSTEDE